MWHLADDRRVQERQEQLVVADELDADWSRIRAEHAPANDTLYKNTVLGVQGTGGSTSIANSYE